jgi:hypothetical protein
MNLGFDIDGVILAIDLFALRFIDNMKDNALRSELSRFYYYERPFQLNPLDFISDDDKLFLITGRNKLYQDITERWAKKYYPSATLVVLDHEEPKAETIIEDWFVKQARVKSKALKKYKIDVYFEDTPQVVRELRKLCPETKIIQYGGRQDE